jgi:chromosome segregation ATPase
MDALRKLAEMVGGAQVSATEAEELAEKLDQKITELKEESLKISETLEEEKSRYLTFQQVKERIVPSIDRYRTELDKIEKDLESIKKAAGMQQSQLKEEAKKSADKLGKEDVKQVMDVAREIAEKKKVMEEINTSMASLAETSESLNRRLALLSQQAKLIEIREAPAGKGPEEETEEKREKESYIREQMQLTKAEEEEFVRKRDELKKLIKKLWEDEK